jgi:RHS repeat-associated protein
VAYKNGGTTLESYSYDALNRRIIQNPGTATDLYYSSDWQVLEERTGGVNTATIQYVWSPVYVDALVLRDRSTQNNGTLDERLWVQQDANWNVTALMNASGSVVERDVYDPYGKVTFLNASWGTLSGSAYAWIYLFQGSRYDALPGLFYFRNRDMSPTLSRWVQLDRGSALGNLYSMLGNHPTTVVDPQGLFLLLPSFPSLAKPVMIEKKAPNYVVECPHVLAEWTVDYGPPKLFQQGWIVQHVYRQIKVYDCDNNVLLDPQPSEFWEAVPVNDPKQKVLLAAFTDAFKIEMNSRSHGSYFVLGNAVFVGFWKPTRPQWQGPNDPGHVEGAGSAITTTTRPWWWFPGRTDRLTVGRWMRFKWDCCPCHTYADFATGEINEGVI